MGETYSSAILHAGETRVLLFDQQPRFFELCRRPFAAQDIRDFSRRVGLAADVGFVGVGRGVAGDDDVESGEPLGNGYSPGIIFSNSLMSDGRSSATVSQRIL